MRLHDLHQHVGLNNIKKKKSEIYPKIIENIFANDIGLEMKIIKKYLYNYDSDTTNFRINRNQKLENRNKIIIFEI